MKVTQKVFQAWFDNEFTDRAPKNNPSKNKMGNSDFFKIKIFCSAKKHG